MIDEIRGYFGEWYDRVDMDDRPLVPSRTRRVVDHSPDFAWGYAGSGAAQLALAILLEAGLPKGEAIILHQQFKREHLEALPDRADFLLMLDVQAWAERTRAKAMGASA